MLIGLISQFGTVNLVQDEVFNRIVRAAAGLTWQEADTAFRRILLI